MRVFVQLLAGILLAACGGAAGAANPTFTALTIDLTSAGDCKMAADIDGDGRPDPIVAGSPGENLRWYRSLTWTKHNITIPDNEFTTDAEAADVDGDSDPDIVVPDGPSGSNLIWFENPRPSGNPSIGSQWAAHTIGAIGDFGKDVEPGDYDGDGRLDVAIRSPDEAIIFFQTAPDAWSRVVIRTGLSGEGMFRGDVDRDGDLDLVLAGFWIENPGGAPARNVAWDAHDIDASLYDEFKAVVGDVNGDGTPDVVYSCSEGIGDVAWYTPSAGDPRGAWTKHVVVPSLDRCHTLQLADMNADGRRDLVLGQLHTTATGELAVYVNQGGSVPAWVKVPVATGGIHNGVVADFNADGAPDIFGCSYTGNPPVHVWLNQSGGGPIPPQPGVTRGYWARHSKIGAAPVQRTRHQHILWRRHAN